jgi:hypothetical protein
MYTPSGKLYLKYINKGESMETAEFTIESSRMKALVNILLHFLRLFIIFGPYTALQVSNDLSPVPIVVIGILLFLLFTCADWVWLFTRKPIAEVNQEGIWIYQIHKRVFFSWTEARKFRFKRDLLFRGGRLIYFYNKPGKYLDYMNTSRAVWDRNQMKEKLKLYARCINDRNNLWG